MVGESVPAVGEGKRGESGHIGYLLRQAAASHRQRIEKNLAPLGLTAAQFSILTMLKAYPGASGAEIARVALLTPQTMSAIATNLEKAGMVERQPHEQHGRIKRLALTEAGSSALEKARERVDRIDQAVTADLTPEENDTIRNWLVAAAKQSSALD